MSIEYIYRFEKSKLLVCQAADEYLWDKTPETLRELENAVAEYRTALGLLRLSERDTND